ncbi:hypothetical protein LTR08_008812 [Meristemomyces frigidus]|nr:hypothetical protein LTR08_008812 [Meristemomyces frigidus]
MAELPPVTGMNFTSTIHNRAEGPTKPENNQRPYVVCVTGAGKGLGYNISLAYASAGATGVVISSRTQSDLDGLEKELLKINPKLEILSQTCDTMKDEDVARLASATKDRFGGRLDVCVANAGVISKYLQDGSLLQGILSDLDFERVIDINVLGSVRTARHFVPLLIASPDGAKVLVGITSLAAHLNNSLFTTVAYNVSKTALCRLIEHMDNDHRQEDGLLSYAAHPGAVLTPQTEKHSLKKDDAWDGLLTDDVGLCGGFLTWLTRERREWLSGRYISVNWDTEELENKKSTIEGDDLLKFSLRV